MLDEVPASEQRTRDAQMLRARLLVQLERGREAVAVLTGLPPGTGREEADRLMLLGLAYSAVNDLPAAEKILRQAHRPGSDKDLVDLACVRALSGDIAEAAALIRMSWHVGFKDPDQLRHDKMLASVRAHPGLIDDLITSPLRHCGTF
jgi:thioredoxin-like negative regulator of GroEL